MSRIVLKAKSVGETNRYEFDFLSQLASGETISTQTVVASVFAGVLPDGELASDIIEGSPWKHNTSVYQRITAGVAGVIYKLTTTITTSASQTLILEGYLAVLNPEGSDVSLECCPRIGNATSADGQAFTMTFPDRPVTTYSDGLQIFAIFDNDVTVAVPTLNCDLLGAKTIKRSEALGIIPYQIKTDDVIHLVFDQDADAFIALNTIPVDWFNIAAADQTAAFTAATDVVVLPAMPAMTVLAVRAGVSTASSSGAVTFDLNDGATTMLSVKLTVDEGETSSVTAAIPAVISVRAHADNWTLKFDIDGAGTGAKGWNIGLLRRLD